MNHKRGLGRGLSALISGSTVERARQFTPTVKQEEEYPTAGQLFYISPDSIIANPYQPRDQFEEKSLEELTLSIQHHGILSPLVVTQREDGKYELIAGERRLRAARFAGLTQVPVIVRKADNHEKLELSLIENIQREDLNPLELAKAYQRLLNEFSLTQEEIGRRLGKSRPLITNTIRLLGLPEEIKDSLIRGEINEGHARALLSIDDKEKQLELWKKISLHSMTVRAVEKEARKISVRSHMRSVQDALLDSFEKKLEEKLGTKVTIRGNADKGSVVIDYFSREELERIVLGLS